MADAEATVPKEHDRCPRCQAPDAVLNLLTSMTRYFSCDRCDHRWQVAVVADCRQDTLGPGDDARVD